MVSIFVSHDWNASALYEDFVTLLDRELGKDSWRNISIPRTRAIDLCDPQAWQAENELDRLEDQLVRVRADMSRPGVPDTNYCAVFDSEGNAHQIETLGTLRAKEYRLLLEMRDLADLQYKPPGEFVDRKNASLEIRLHPELSLAIRRQVKTADIVFILVTPFCRFRRWINFEIAVCADRRAKVIAVLADGHPTRDLDVDCHQVVKWDAEEIRNAIKGVIGSNSGLEK